MPLWITIRYLHIFSICNENLLQLLSNPSKDSSFSLIRYTRKIRESPGNFQLYFLWLTCKSMKIFYNHHGHFHTPRNLLKFPQKFFSKSKYCLEISPGFLWKTLLFFGISFEKLLKMCLRFSLIVYLGFFQKSFKILSKLPWKSHLS